MTTLDSWARRHSIPPEAVRELKQIMGVCPMPSMDPSANDRPEAQVAKRVRFSATQQGTILWRNNVGVFTDPATGIPYRFGLANDTPQMNKEVKSHDLIGITPRLIQQDDVGLTIGQFTAVETKAGGWKYTGSAREKAQLRFAEIVLAHGGFACFATQEVEF